MTIATATLAWSNLIGGGLILTGLLGNIVGVIALLSCVFLTAGWWFRNEWFAEWGLLLAVGCWSTRAMFSILHDSETTLAGPLLSVAWAVGAGGAYILERYDHVVSKSE